MALSESHMLYIPFAVWNVFYVKVVYSGHFNIGSLSDSEHMSLLHHDFRPRQMLFVNSIRFKSHHIEAGFKLWLLLENIIIYNELRDTILCGTVSCE